jgi:hypothetical protein
MESGLSRLCMELFQVASMHNNGLGKRLHFFGGTCLRIATAPWRQKTIFLDEAVTIFGASFGAGGWHHLRKTLEEYDRNPSLAVQNTTLFRFLNDFQPTSISELAGWSNVKEHLPIFVYPWGTFRKGETSSIKNVWNSRFCGPSTSAFIEDEFARIETMYRNMRQFGYRPWKYSCSFIGGTMLLKRDGQRRFVVLQGNHRTAILAHLGACSSFIARYLHGYLSVLKEDDVEKWPLVISGRCSVPHARSIFNFFFENNGRHIEHRINHCPADSKPA